MGSSRDRQKTADEVHTRCLEMLTDAVTRGSMDWPLPHPPIIESELPIIEPQSPAQIQQQAIGLFTTDRAKFNSLLDEAREVIIPHRLSLTADPEREGEKWILRRINSVSRLITFGFCEGWLASALDNSAPDTTRWYIGIAVLNGLADGKDGMSENRGYQMLECIAMAKPPIRWPTKAEAGPHQLDWNPNSDNHLQLIDDSAGIDAAHWLMDTLQNSDDERRLLLVKWMRSMMERPSLVIKMAIHLRFIEMANSQPELVLVHLVQSLPRLLEVNREAGLEVLTSLKSSNSKRVNIALSEILPALLRTTPEQGLELLDHLAISENINSRSAATAALKELAKIDTHSFKLRCGKAATDPNPAIRRLFIQSCMREYIELDPTDTQVIFQPLWVENDEVAAVRMRELLMRMQENDPPSFSILASKLLQKSQNALDRLWRTMRVRSEERVSEWRTHLEGDGVIPEPLT